MENCINLYTLYDKLAEEAGGLFQAVNHHVAMRASAQLIKDVNCLDDYQLMHVGYFNTRTAEIIPLGQVQVIPFIFVTQLGNIKAVIPNEDTTKTITRMEAAVEVSNE